MTFLSISKHVDSIGEIEDWIDAELKNFSLEGSIKSPNRYLHQTGLIPYD